MLDPQTSELLTNLATMTQDWAARQTGNDILSARTFAAHIFKRFAGESRDEPGGFCTNILVAGAIEMRPARLYRPPDGGDKLLPAVIFLHGGGWALGDLDSYDGLMLSLCMLSGAVFISVDYRLAPEHPFPAGLDDALAATRWIAAHAIELGIDGERLAVMGDSAGGNLAAVVAQQSLLHGSPQLAAQYLIYPVIDVSQPHTSYLSRITNGDGDHFLTRAAIDLTLAWYIGTEGQPDDPKISPICARQLAGLPPAYILAAGHDPLRDEAKAYFDRLRDAGVESTFHCFDSTIHAFLSFGVLDVAQRARRELASAIRHRLGTTTK